MIIVCLVEAVISCVDRSLPCLESSWMIICLPAWLGSWMSSSEWEKIEKLLGVDGSVHVKSPE